jgi:hypothetical protein
MCTAGRGEDRGSPPLDAALARTAVKKNERGRPQKISGFRTPLPGTLIPSSSALRFIPRRCDAAPAAPAGPLPPRADEETGVAVPPFQARLQSSRPPPPLVLAALNGSDTVTTRHSNRNPESAGILPPQQDFPRGSWDLDLDRGTRIPSASQLAAAPLFVIPTQTSSCAPRQKR